MGMFLPPPGTCMNAHLVCVYIYITFPFWGLNLPLDFNLELPWIVNNESILALHAGTL